MRRSGGLPGVRVAALCAALFALAGCPAPPFAPGAPCNDDGDCPANQACVAGECRPGKARDPAPLDDAGRRLDDGGVVPDDGADPNDDAGPALDGGIDAGAALDGGIDAGVVDAGLFDAGLFDAGFVDAGFVDAGLVDAGPPPRLLAVRPALVSGGEVRLEGRFPTGTTVVFPGGDAVALQPSGAARTVASVPAGASAGALVVTAPGGDAAPLPFRRAAFPLALGPSRALPAQTSGAQAAPRLGVERIEPASVRVGDDLYLVGGHDSVPSVHASVERARVFADGSLGAFRDAGASLLVEREGACAVAVGDHIYVIGGQQQAGAYTPLVERATRLADGSLSAFAAASELVTARRSAGCVVIGESLYVVGGQIARDPNDFTGSVERAPLLEDGSLGPFEAVTSSLQAPRARHATLVIDDELLVLGGTTAANYVEASVERAPIADDGSLGAFETLPFALVAPRRDMSALRLDDTLYVIGGTEAPESLEAAPLANGSLAGPFATLPFPLAAPRRGHTAEIVDNHVYLFGGHAPSGQTTERLSLQAGGGLGAFTAYRDDDAVRRARLTSVVLGDFVYLIGGVTTGTAPTAQIARAPIAKDGTLGPFEAAGALSVARSRPTLARVGDYLYVLGGAQVGSPLTSIERASIADDGSLGAFSVVAEELVRGRAGAVAVVTPGWLHVMGGCTSIGGARERERAPIADDGTLGPFEVAGTLASARDTPGVAVVADKVYLFGGADLSLFGCYSSGDAQDTVEVAPILADGTLDASTALPAAQSLVRARTETTALELGSFLYVIGGGGFVERAPIGADGTLGAFTEAGALPRDRSRHALVPVGDYVYLLGGTGPTDATLSVIDRARLE